MTSWSTARLSYSLTTLADAPELFAALDHPEVGRFIGGPDVTTLHNLQCRIEWLLTGPPPDRADQTWINAVVRRSRDRTVIGRLEATVHPGWAELAWVLGPEHWGRGYGTEAAGWLIDHLAEVHHVTELWATVDPGNLASVKLLRRWGFEEQGARGRRTPESFDEGDLVFARGLRKDHQS